LNLKGQLAVNKGMRNISLLLGLLLLGLGARHLSAAPSNLYVAPSGDDRWSGRLESASADRQDGPKATLASALVASRAIAQNAQAGDGVTILLRGGLHQLDRPVQLSPEDSGAGAKKPLTVAAYPGEKPILSGGRRISGWQKVQGQEDLWQTEIAEVREGKWYFRQLFINGERKQRARTPNEGFFRVQGASPQDKPVKLRFSPGDIKKAWADEGDVEVIALLAWADL
jgi:hypothetical protein